MRALVESWGQLLPAVTVLLGPLPLSLWALRGETGGPRIPGVAHRMLVGSILWCAIQIALGLLAGTLHLLRPVPVVAAESALLTVGLVLLLRRSEPAPRVTVPDADAAAPPPARTQPGLLSPTHAGLLMCVLVAGATLAWQLLSRPPLNFDSQAYHVPIMARWVREGHFALFDELGQVARYPHDWELLCVLQFLSARSDLLVAVTNLLAWAQLGLATLLLARWYGATGGAAAAAGALVMSVPAVLARVEAIQPDIALAACVGSAFYLGLRQRAEPSRAQAVAFALALALLCGVKMSGPVYALLVLAALAADRAVRARTASDRSTSDAPRAQALSAGGRILLLLGALWVGGFWYGRNLLDLGNPLGYVGSATTSPGGESLDARALLSTTLLAHAAPGRTPTLTLMSSVAREWLGLPFFALAGLALWGLVRQRQRLRLQAPASLLPLLLLLLGAVAAYACTPYGGDNTPHGGRLTSWFTVNLRFGFALLPLLGALAAQGMSWARLGELWLLPLPVLGFVLGVVATLTPVAWVLRAAVAVGWTVAGLAVWPRARSFTRARSALAACALLLLLGSVVCAQAQRARARHRLEIYGSVVATVDSLAGPRDVVGYVDTQELAPFLGPQWSRKLIPVAPGSDDRAQWIARLRREQITTVLAGVQRTPGEAAEPSATTAREIPQADRVLQWAAEPDSPLQLVHKAQSQRKDLNVVRLTQR